jgi:glycerol-3-phosphate dehydrogenase
MSRLSVLQNEKFDILVLGAGATGVAVARDAALRGLRTLVIDRGDIACGTSSGSSRMVHGGLRYLLSGQVALVKQCLAERSTMMHLAPHLVRRAPFFITSYRNAMRERWPTRLGLSLIRQLSSEPELEISALWRRDRLLDRIPTLQRQGLRGAAVFSDGVANDARLCLAVAQGASNAGAEIATYMQALEVKCDASGRAIAIRVRDRLNGEETVIHGRVIVQAMGVWSNTVDVGPRGESPGVAPSRGVHLAYPPLMPEGIALAALHPRDSRYVWAVGSTGHTWVGTTDEPDTGAPDACEASADEVLYLHEWVRAILPGADSSPFLTRAALRPLVDSANHSRDFACTFNDAGVLVVLGGKLTTARAMAESAVDLALTAEPFTGLSPRKSATRYVPLPGAPSIPIEQWINEWDDLPVEPAVRSHLLNRHGQAGVELLQRIVTEPELGVRLHPDRVDVLVEVDHAVEHEWVTTLSDFMWRRTHLACTRDCGSAAIETISRRLAKMLNWTRQESDAQIQRYWQEVERARRPLQALVGRP